VSFRAAEAARLCDVENFAEVRSGLKAQHNSGFCSPRCPFERPRLLFHHARRRHVLEIRQRQRLPDSFRQVAAFGRPPGVTFAAPPGAQLALEPQPDDEAQKLPRRDRRQESVGEISCRRCRVARPRRLLRVEIAVEEDQQEETDGGRDEAYREADVDLGLGLDPA
jgi:hypothetical protein